MAITPLSTPSEIEAEYLASCSYDTENDVAKCRRFMIACRAILLRRPTKAARGAADSSQNMEWDLASIKAELDGARSWYAYAPAATASRGGGITHPSFAELRDYGSQQDNRSYGTG